MKWCLITTLLLASCTPNLAEVKAAAQARMSEVLAQPVDILQVKSDFNEGNGDPARVLIWARARADADLMWSISARFEGGKLDLDVPRLKKRVEDGQRDLALTRAFNTEATRHFDAFISRVSFDAKSATHEATLLLYQPPCPLATCALYKGLRETVAAFRKAHAGPLELTVYFDDPGAHAKSQGQILHYNTAPSLGRKVSVRNAAHVIFELPVGPDTDETALRRAVKLHASSNAYHNHLTAVRKKLTETLSRTRGQPWSLQPGGSYLELVPPSLTTVRHKATACPKSALKKSKRCTKEAATEVACEMDLSSGALTLLPDAAR